MSNKIHTLILYFILFVRSIYGPHDASSVKKTHNWDLASTFRVIDFNVIIILCSRVVCVTVYDLCILKNH